jgi:purine-binding chemotaxis protein CheW
VTREADASLLLVQADRLTCALPLRAVSEIMRALPLRALGGLPPYVRGASIIRGQATPVVDLAVLLGGQDLSAPSRYVVLVGGSPVALAVDAVLGVRALSRESLGGLPRLLRDFGSQHVHSLGSLDGELVPVLASTIVLPDDTWQRVRAEGAVSGAAGAP